LLYRFDVGNSTSNEVFFSHDGSLVATTTGDSCHVWDVHTGTTKWSFGTQDAGLDPLDAVSFLPGDTSILMWGFEIRSLTGEILRTITPPFDNRPMISRLPDGRYIGGFTGVWPDSTVEFFDLNLGKVTNSVTAYERYNVGAFIVNPVTGDFATGGQDLIYYKSIDPAPLNAVHPISPQPVDFDAFTTHNRISIRFTAPQGNSRVMVYSIEGRYVYSSSINGPLPVETGPLASGVYFVVLINERGERAFRKVSVIE
jgi:WD40 repeat protein